MLTRSLTAFFLSSTLATSAFAIDIDPTLGFSGSVEAAASFQTGNVEEEQLKLGITGEQERENWRHQLKAQAFNSKQNDQRIAEEYRVDLGTNYKLNDRDYLYGGIGYVGDRFSGFSYRITESVGVGRRWVDDGTYLLDTRIGPGFRHTKLTNGDKENDWIIKGGLLAGWVLNEHVELGEDLTVEYSPEFSVITSQAFAKSKLSESLALRLGFDVEHVTEVPLGREKTDTRSTVGVVYDF